MSSLKRSGRPLDVLSGIACRRDPATAPRVQCHIAMAWPIGCLDDERSKHVLIERAADADLAACERLIKAFWVLIGMVARIYDGLPSVDRTALRQDGMATCPGPCAALTPTGRSVRKPCVVVGAPGPAAPLIERACTAADGRYGALDLVTPGRAER
jgi:hypothetical protein